MADARQGRVTAAGTTTQSFERVGLSAKDVRIKVSSRKVGGEGGVGLVKVEW